MHQLPLAWKTPKGIIEPGFEKILSVNLGLSPLDWRAKQKGHHVRLRTGVEAWDAARQQYGKNRRPPPNEGCQYVVRLIQTCQRQN